MNLKDIRNYFGENDKTQFEHSAFHYLDKLIKEQTWVNANERLPDNCGEHLVVLENTGNWERKISISHLNPAKTGFYVEYDDIFDTPNEKVTHWMPLPEPPKD